MLGVVIGAVCAFVAIKIARHRFGYRRHFGGYGYGNWHERGCVHHGRWGSPEGGPYRQGWDDDGDNGPPWRSSRDRASGGRGGRGWGGRGGFAMNAIFDRLDTTPGQEKVIRAALDDLKSKARALKQDVRGMRGDLATALRGESLDAETLGTVASRATTATDALRDAAIGAMLKVHEALDEKQRALAADALEGGFGALRGRRRAR